MIRKILIIDDDVDFNEAVGNFLDAAGYKVDSETKELNAVKKIKEFRPDLILLDIVMDTENSGFEIAKEIARNSEIASIPIVFLTGYFYRTGIKVTDNEEISRLKNVKEVIDKPVKPSVLIEVIKKLS